MTDDRITDIFRYHGQYVTGKERAFIRAIAEAVSPQRTWVGLTDEEREIASWTDGSFGAGARWAEAKLKEKNT